MTDLIEKVTWLRANDEVARKIGDAGRELAEAMTEPQEIVRAAPVIAAAIRTAAGHAMTDLTFGTGMAGNDVLRTGWLPPVADGVSAAGFEGHLELPKPLGLDDYILSVDVSLAASPSQRLTIMANGEILVQRTLNERTTIHCALRRSVATADEVLSVGLYFPDARINASPANPLDARRLSVTLHGIRVTAARCCSEGEHPDITVAREELLSGGSESVVHDLWATCPTPLSAEKPRALRTIHGTVMYADLASGRVRHGKPGAAPANLFLDQGNGRANLVRVGAGGREFGVRLRPEGRHAASAQRQHETADRFVRTFEIVDVGDPERRTFGLRGAGLFVCAEIDGSVTLSRDRPGAWERFAVEPNET